MESFEKVEKLRERADVTYEEAKEALEASGWDLLEAMVYLEKQGKAKGPSQETYSTNYEDQQQFVSVKDKVKKQKKTSDGYGTKLGKLLKLLLKKCTQNSFCISRNGEEVLEVPLITVLILLFFLWKPVLIALVAGLFFDCRYSFCGKDKMESANEAMDKAGEFVDKVKDQFEEM